MSRVLDTWSYEAMAMAFSLGYFVAIILILITYNNNTVPQYFPGVTLNAIISTLGTASKSALLYVIAECIGQLKWI
jgi:Holliday junction resolvasome RuvABC endonuclease subunit